MAYKAGGGIEGSFIYLPMPICYVMIFNYAIAAPVRVHAAGLYEYIYIHV